MNWLPEDSGKNKRQTSKDQQQQPFYNQIYNILRIPTTMGVTWRGVKKEQPATEKSGRPMV